MSPYTRPGPPPPMDLDSTLDSTGDPPLSPSVAPKRTHTRGLPTWMWLVVFMIVLVVAQFYASHSPPAAFAWTNDLEEGLAAAKGKNQLVLVAFTTSGCPACVQMDREVLSKEPVGRALSDWVAVKVNPNSNSRLAARFGIHAVPTYVILTPDGARLEASAGTMDLTSFVGWLDRTERTWRERKATALAERR